jgi:Flp pilus assembly protein TadB
MMILALLLLAAAIIVWGVLTVQDRRRAAMDARIKTVVESLALEVDDTPKPEREGLNRRVTRLMRGLPANYGERVEAAMATTGGKITPVKLLIVGVVAIIVTFILTRIFNFTGLIGILIALASGYVVPLFYFRRARGKYRTSFLEVFPDALDLIARIVRAGVPVSTGIEVAGNESPEPVRSVFAEIASQNRVGISFEDSLNRMVKRLVIADFSFFASALVLQRESGGNIAETVSNLSAIVRKRKELRKKGEALTAEARTVAGILGALPFVTAGLVALINFEYIALLFTDSRGQMILGSAMMMLFMGMMIMRGMINRALR